MRGHLHEVQRVAHRQPTRKLKVHIDQVAYPTTHNAFNANEERGLYKTTDGGRTWEKVLFISDEVGISDVELLPGKGKSDIVHLCDLRDGTLGPVCVVGVSGNIACGKPTLVAITPDDGQFEP